MTNGTKFVLAVAALMAFFWITGIGRGVECHDTMRAVSCG